MIVHKADEATFRALCALSPTGTSSFKWYEVTCEKCLEKNEETKWVMRQKNK